jgi:hypothetical protein
MLDKREYFYRQSQVLMPPGWTMDNLYSVVNQTIANERRAD